ncbi:MAG: ABC transporter permease subunit [Pseudobdellovibrio sp.]
MKANAVKFFLAILFLFPFLVLIYHFKLEFNLDVHDIQWALKNSILQSTLSSLITCSVGYMLSLGLLTAPQKYRGFLRAMSLVPSFLPSIFIVLVALSLVSPFPMGSYGIVFVMCLTYTGYVAAMMSIEIEQRLGVLGFVSEVFGLTKWSFLRKVILPLSFKPLLILFIIISINVFTSFSVPLLVGGGKGTNLEVLIYEKIFIDQNWSQALTLSFIQMLFISVFSLVFIYKEKLTSVSVRENRLIFFPIAKYLLYFSIGVFFWGYFSLVKDAFGAYYLLQMLDADFFIALLHSFLFFLVSLLILYTLIFLTTYLVYRQKSILFLNIFLNPSTAVIGFSVYLLSHGLDLFRDLVKVSVLFALMSFVSLYKLFIQPKLDILQQQIFISNLYNVRYIDFFFKIFLPQIKQILFYVTSLTFIYCVSDFAFIKTSGANFQTLGVIMQSYLSSYRMEGAFIVSLVILSLWGIVTFFLGALFGVYKKS